jgi:hypothetical protein
MKHYRVYIEGHSTGVSIFADALEPKVSGVINFHASNKLIAQFEQSMVEEILDITDKTINLTVWERAA